MDPQATTPEPVVDGRYRVLGWLGTGGQAVVLRVFDQRLGVPRALKVMMPSSARKQKMRDRFQAEATAMAQLDHPHILRVFDIAEADGLPYYVMEMVEGGTLAGRIQRLGPLEPREAVEAALQVCGGLAMAHANGVIHRDIKPQNVLVSAEGACKVLDFGIARIEDQRRTRAGATLGTEGYMAPEQARDASAVDARADVFSVGMLIFVMISGRDPVEWLAGRGRERLPESVRAVVERATAEDPSSRFPSAAALSEALRACLTGLPEPQRLRLRGPLPPTTGDEEDEEVSTEIVEWLARRVNVSLRPDPNQSSGEGKFRMLSPGAVAGAPPPGGAAPSLVPPPRRPSVPPPPPSGRYEIGVDRLTPTVPPAPPKTPPEASFDGEVAPVAALRQGRLPATWAVLGAFVVLLAAAAAVHLVSVAVDGWNQASERSAEASAAALAAESQLHFALRADLSLVSQLTEMGADRSSMDQRLAAWEGSAQEPARSQAALALIDHLGATSRELAPPGSTWSHRLEPALQRLRKAAAAYRETHPPAAVAR